MGIVLSSFIGVQVYAQKPVIGKGQYGDKRADTKANPVGGVTDPSDPKDNSQQTPVTAVSTSNDPAKKDDSSTPIPATQEVNGTNKATTNTDTNGSLGKKGGLQHESQVGGLTKESKHSPKDKKIADGTQTGKEDPVDKKGSDKKTPVQKDDADPSRTDDQASAATESKAPCEDEALQKIYQLLLHDSSNVMGSLYELTSMRLARRAVEQGATTLEEMVKQDAQKMKEKVAAIDGSKEFQSQLQAIYESYGKSSDLSVINNDLDTALKKGKDACYWCRGQRLWNDHASAYVLALSVGEKDSELSDVDAATIWTVEKIRQAAAKTNSAYKYGHEYGNLMNISTRVARYLGRIDDGQDATKEDLDAQISSVEEAVMDAIAKAYEQVKVTLHSCIEDHNKDCPDCQKKAIAKFETDNLAFDKIQRGLLQAVSKSENIKMEKALKAKMGDVTFDLSGFAKGTVPPDNRRGKYDACGHLLPQRGHSVKATPKSEATPTPSPAPFHSTLQQRYEKPAIDKTYVAPRYPMNMKLKPKTNNPKPLWWNSLNTDQDEPVDGNEQ